MNTEVLQAATAMRTETSTEELVRKIPPVTVNVAILIPIFNDWGSLARLLPEIDTTLGLGGLQGWVTVVDDGSTLAPPDEVGHQEYVNFRRVELVRLRC